MAQLMNRTFDTGQLQILTNFINAALMTRKLPYVWSRGVMGPYFFEDKDGKAITITLQRYAEMIN